MIAKADDKIPDSERWMHLSVDLEAVAEHMPDTPPPLPLMRGRRHAERLATLRSQIDLLLAAAWERMVLAQRHAFELEFIANEKESERN